MPCSPVQVPSMAMARLTRRWLQLLGTVALGRVVGVDQVAKVKVAVAHVAHQEEGDGAVLRVVHRLQQRIGQAARWARRRRW